MQIIPPSTEVVFTPIDQEAWAESKKQRVIEPELTGESRRQFEEMTTAGVKVLSARTFLDLPESPITLVEVLTKRGGQIYFAKYKGEVLEAAMDAAYKAWLSRKAETEQFV